MFHITTQFSKNDMRSNFLVSSNVLSILWIIFLIADVILRLRLVLLPTLVSKTISFTNAERKKSDEAKSADIAGSCHALHTPF